MASKKTQEELEQPAKNYQIDAIDKQVSNLTTEMRNNFTTVNANIQTLIQKSEGQVSPQTLQETIAALKTSIDSRIDEEVEKIHLKYGPTKDSIKWLLRTVGVVAIGIVGQIVTTALILSKASQ